MLNISLIVIGKLKEKYWKSAVDEYSKRLSKFCKVNIIEIKDEPNPDNPSEKEKKMVLDKEGDNILKKIPNSSYVISLCVEGEQKSSEKFAKIFSDIPLEGICNITFIIGGSMGLSENVKNISNLRLSFSKMTFPHQMMRVVLLEQIYRGFTIIEGRTYHK